MGEASHPGPRRRTRRMGLCLPATQVDNDTNDDERFLLPARRADAARVEASQPREFDMVMDDSSAEEPRQADVGSNERQLVPRVPVKNRFQALSGQESDTESCEVSDRKRHRRLRLIWNPPREGVTSTEPLRPAAGAIPREARSCFLVGKGFGSQDWCGPARESGAESNSSTTVVTIERSVDVGRSRRRCHIQCWNGPHDGCENPWSSMGPDHRRCSSSRGMDCS